MVTNSAGSRTRSLAVDAGGNFYGTKNTSSDLVKYDPDGIEIWSQAVSSTTDFRTIELGNDGNIYTIGSGTTSTNSRVRLYDPLGNFIKSVLVYSRGRQHGSLNTLGQLFHINRQDALMITDTVEGTISQQNDLIAQCVAADPDESVYIGFTSGFIQKRNINPWAAATWSVGHFTDFISGIAVDANFVYAASNDGTAGKINKTDGSLVWTYTMPASVSSIDIRPDGFVFVGDANGNLDKLDSEGNQIWRYSGHTDVISEVVAFPIKYGADPSQW